MIEAFYTHLKVAEDVINVLETRGGRKNAVRGRKLIESCIAGKPTTVVPLLLKAKIRTFIAVIEWKSSYYTRLEVSEDSINDLEVEKTALEAVQEDEN